MKITRSAINRDLCSLLRDGESFATGLFGLIDLHAEALALCAVGSPSPCTGLAEMINHYGFPKDEEGMDQLMEKVLLYSNQIRFPDDVTMLAIQYTGRNVSDHGTGRALDKAPLNS